MTFYFVVCFTEKIIFQSLVCFIFKKRMTESVPLDRHVVYIICTYSRTKPITFPGGTNSLEYSMETRKQSLDLGTNNQYSHTCL